MQVPRLEELCPAPLGDFSPHPSQCFYHHQDVLSSSLDPQLAVGKGPLSTPDQH